MEDIKNFLKSPEHRKSLFDSGVEYAKKFIEQRKLLNKKDEIILQIDKGILTIQYDHKNNIENNTDKVIRREFHAKSFKRSFSLDDKINTSAIDAALENGVLTLTLPLKEDITTPKKQITIK